MIEPKIAPEKIIAARALKHGAVVEMAPSSRARCRECFQLIEKGTERIMFASGLPFPATVAYIHADRTLCETKEPKNLKTELAKPRKLSPNERSSWTLPTYLLTQAYDTAIPDHRRPRHRVTCRGCGGVIEIDQDRVAYKLRDDAGWGVRDAEGQYLGDGFLHANCPPTLAESQVPCEQ